MEIFIPIIFIAIGAWLYALYDGDKYFDGTIRGAIKLFKYVTKKQGPHEVTDKHSNEVRIANYKDGVLHGAMTFPEDPETFLYFWQGVEDGFNSRPKYGMQSFSFVGTYFWKKDEFKGGYFTENDWSQDSERKRVYKKSYVEHSFRINGKLSQDIWVGGNKPGMQDKEAVFMTLYKEEGDDSFSYRFSDSETLFFEDITKDEAIKTNFEGEKTYFWDQKEEHIMARENYKNGMKEGIQEYYYDSGVLEYRLNFKEGMPHGTWKWYSEDGKYTHSIDCSKILKDNPK